MTASSAPLVLRCLPNAITTARLALLPVLVALFLDARLVAAEGGDAGPLRWAVVGVLLVIAGGDVLDGWVARRFDVTSRLGAVLDPLADKLAQVTGLVLFTFFAEPAFTPLPWVLLVLLVARDLMLSVGSLVLRLTGRIFEVRAARAGKLATVAIFGLLLAEGAGAPRALVLSLVAAAGALVVLSGVRYFRRGLALWAGGDRRA